MLLAVHEETPGEQHCKSGGGSRQAHQPGKGRQQANCLRQAATGAENPRESTVSCVIVGLSSN